MPDSDTITEAGDAILLRPGICHDYGTARGASGWELLWTHFLPRPHWLPWLDWPEVAPGICRLSLGQNADAVQTALADMYRRARGGSPRRDDWAMHALESALLLCDQANPRAQSGRIDARIARATDYLLEHLCEPI